MYQNIFVDKKNEKIYLFDDEKGMAELPLVVTRYAYRKSPNGKFKSLYGDTLDRIHSFDEKDTDLFESDVLPEMKVLLDAYPDSDEPSKGHRIVVIDIEVDSTGGFPDITEGDKPITAIALYDYTTDKYICFVLDPEGKVVNESHDNVVIQPYKSEEELLTSFINKWEEINPTIVTGWNINYFDIPYLFNRIRAVLGKAEAYKLSSIRIAYQNKFNKKMIVGGISCLDYIELYKKFLGVMRPSYALGAVAKIEELKTQKITYKGSLTDLYKTDIHRFVEYNLADVKIVVELDKKYDFIYLARSVCHKGHIPYEWFQMSSRFIDGAILMYLHRHNLIAPNKPIGGREEYEEMAKEGEEGFVGAYVKEPVPGIYDWIYSADITSLYPSTIMSLNISPETKAGKVDGWDYKEFHSGNMPIVRVGDTAYTDEEFKALIADNKLSISSNGVLYRQDFLGVVPTILDLWFSERIEFRELAKKHKKEGNAEKASFYDRRQLRQKIFLNCFSPDTKVIAGDGIKYITEIKVGDQVYSLNKETGKSELKPVVRVYEYDYEGDMVHFETNHIDFLVTPNHRFWISKLGKKKYKSFGWENAESIYNDKVRRKFPKINLLSPCNNPTNLYSKEIDLSYYAKLYKMECVFRGNFNDEIRIKRDDDNKQKRHTTFIPRYYHIEDWLELMGWFISEGSLYMSTPKKYDNGHSRGTSYKIHIAQEIYQQEIKDLLTRMRIPFHQDTRGFSISNDLIYKFLENNCGNKSENKKIPSWVFYCSSEKLKHLCKSLMMGDGHKSGTCYTTKSSILKDGFIRLCFHIGEVYAFVRDYDGCYRIQINKIRGRGPTLKSNHRKLLPYKGKVYCVEVEDNHTLLCGRNDKYQWAGQSVYGTLGLPVFRFYDRDNAEATTISGQTIIKAAEHLVNSIYRQKYQAAGRSCLDEDFVKYIDTDSVYVSAAPLALCESEYPSDMKKFTIESASSIAAQINEFYKMVVPKVFNIKPEKNRIKIVGDVIAKKSMWIAKKRYAMLKVFDMESMSDVKDKNGNEGKMEVKGIDTVRSSFPAAFRKIASEILDMLLRGSSNEEINAKILKFEETIEDVPILDLGKTTSVKFVSQRGDINYNPSGRRIFQFEKKTPVGVKSALAYNDLLKVWALTKKIEPIYHGQKVKWVYLIPNEFGIDSLALRGDDTDPDQIIEFTSKYIDRMAMYKAELKSKLSEFYDVMKWDYPNFGTQISNDFFGNSESGNDW
jgi:DNA polymerase I